jgi:hypothetical protein
LYFILPVYIACLRVINFFFIVIVFIITNVRRRRPSFLTALSPSTHLSKSSPL